MDELIKNYIDTLKAVDNAKIELINEMKKQGLKKLVLPDKSFIIYVERKVQEFVRHYKAKEVNE